MKKFLATLLVLCFIVIPFIFAGCESQNTVVLEGGPSLEDEVVGNGSFVVKKGDYLYFANGYVKTSDLGTGGLNNELGNVENGALCRAKVEYVTEGTAGDEDFLEKLEIKNVELLLSKVVGFDNSGLYIFGDKIYFGTPATSRDNSGNVEYKQITFYSMNLDGTNLTKIYQTNNFDGGEYKFVSIENEVYLIIKNDSKLLRVSTNGKETLLAEKVQSAIIEKNIVYYTLKNEKSTDRLDYGTVLYSKNIKTLEEYKLFEEEYLTITLLKFENEKLYYTRNYLVSEKVPSTSSFVYANILSGETFKDGETKLLNQTDISEISEISSGTVYISGGKLYLRNSTLKKLSSSASKILFTQGNLVYYVDSSALYRVDASAENPSGKKLSGSNTINTEYLDIDDGFVYFFVKNSTTNVYELYSLDIKYLGTNATPTKVN